DAGEEQHADRRRDRRLARQKGNSSGSKGNRTLNRKAVSYPVFDKFQDGSKGSKTHRQATRLSPCVALRRAKAAITVWRATTRKPGAQIYLWLYETFCALSFRSSEISTR